jgi:small subunit ribosomal protein S9
MTETETETVTPDTDTDTDTDTNTKTTETTERYYGTGRRKSAVARVWLLPGVGKVEVNNRTLDEYFPRATNRMIVMQPLVLTDTDGTFNLKINVNGGGQTGQADAIKHGISRALVKYKNEFRPSLKRAGFLTRDARVKERKKYGQPGARKRFQYSKR